MNRPSLGGRSLWVAALLIACGSSYADEYSDNWGPSVGSVLPTLSAPDQTGAVRTLDDLAGDNGLLLFMNRSADW